MNCRESFWDVIYILCLTAYIGIEESTKHGFLLAVQLDVESDTGAALILMCLAVGGQPTPGRTGCS